MKKIVTITENKKYNLIYEGETMMFDSLRDIAKYLDVTISTVHRILKGKKKSIDVKCEKTGLLKIKTIPQETLTKTSDIS